MANMYLRKKKHLFHNDISPPIFHLYYPMKGYFCEFINKISKGLTMQINFHSLLWKYIKWSIFCIYICDPDCIY